VSKGEVNPAFWTVDFDDVLRLGIICLVNLVEGYEWGGDRVGGVLQNLNWWII
jgi:hypothetical protein